MKDENSEWLKKEQKDIAKANVIINSLKEHQLIDGIEKIVEEFLEKMDEIRHREETRKIVEEHAAAERAIQNNGWIDFDPENTEDLIDDQNYLIRYLGKDRLDKRGKCPHIAYWDAEEEEFVLLHTTTFMPPVVHQYFKIPE